MVSLGLYCAPVAFLFAMACAGPLTLVAGCGSAPSVSSLSGPGSTVSFGLGRQFEHPIHHADWFRDCFGESFSGFLSRSGFTTSGIATPIRGPDSHADRQVRT